MTDSKDARFWNRMAKKYAAKPVDDQESYEHKLELTRALLRPQMRVLEVGCGTGSTALTHAPHVQLMHAIDFSSRMIEIARAKASDGDSSNVRFEVGTLEDVESEQPYDVVLALSVVHLLENRADFFAKVHALLPPGGYFVSSTVCMGETMPFFRYLAPIGRALGVLPVLRIFKKAQLIEELEAAGFRIESRFDPSKGGLVCFLVARRDG